MLKIKQINLNYFNLDLKINMLRKRVSYFPQEIYSFNIGKNNLNLFMSLYKFICIFGIYEYKYSVIKVESQIHDRIT